MEDHVLMRKSGHDLSGGGDSGDEGCCGEDVVAKVGSKRAFHETEDLNSSLTEPTNKDLSWTKQAATAANKERSAMDSDSKASSSSQKEHEDNWLESARAEMGEVREENQRLKMHLGQMMKDYQALQVQFYNIIQQEGTKKSTSTVDINHDHRQTVEESELVSLSLGRFSSEHIKKEGKSKTSSQGKENDEEEEDIAYEGLSLGLGCKFRGSKSPGNEQSSPDQSPVDISEEQPKEEAGEITWPSKIVKSPVMASGEDETVQQNPLKKARVCVRARCDTPTMNDGCQWRKYGQKIAKGNPCPRAYYRCTASPSCPVRKQVQRCADDMSILITTYEGTHNHPLPLSATAMASTTSAAASMLLSGSSSTSRAATNNPSSTSTTVPANLHGLNFYLSNNSNNKQFYLHNSSFSPSPSHPTITLDLTSSNLSSSSPFTRSFSSSTYPSKFAPTNTLNFDSSESIAAPWSNSFFTYGNSITSQPYNKNPLVGNLNLCRSTMENNILQSMQNRTPAAFATNTTHQPPLPDTIAAATKAITADPSFQSALAAALTSIIGTGNGGGGSGGGGNLSCGNNSVSKLKWEEQFPVANSYSATINSAVSKGNACATSYLNKTTSANTQAGTLMFLPQNSLPFSSPKSASASPNDRDHTS